MYMNIEKYSKYYIPINKCGNKKSSTLQHQSR